MNWKMRVQIKALVFLIALMLALMLTSLGVAFAGWAVYLALDVHFPPETAALLTASASLALLLLMILIALLLNKRNRIRAPRERGDVDQLEDLFRAAVDPAVTSWIKKNPAGALALSLIAGVAVSYTGNTNAVIKDLLAVVSEAAKGMKTKT
jgi:hypothetical protein